MLPISYVLSLASGIDDLLVGDDSVDFGAVVSLDTEADLRVGDKVVTVVRDGGLVDKSELVGRDTVFVG